MARYDSPGYPDQLPGFPVHNSHDYGTASGSARPLPSDSGAPTHSGTVLDRDVIVSHDGKSAQVPPDRMAVVSAADTSSMTAGPYGETNDDDFTAVALDYGGQGRFQPGSGSAGHNRHPDAGR